MIIDQEEKNKIKDLIEEFFSKMTIEVSSAEISILPAEVDLQQESGPDFQVKKVVSAELTLEEPQIMIGQQGQTLFEIQRLLRMILNKRLGQAFYLNLDINEYKKKKIEYLKDLARELADSVALAKEEKSLPPMSSYERRIVHAELSQRTDVLTESQGQGPDRHIVIRPK